MRKTDSLTTFMCRLSRNSGSLSLMQRQGSVQACNRIALLLKLTSDNNQQTGAFVFLRWCMAYVGSWLLTIREKVAAAHDKRAGASEELEPAKIPLISSNFPHEAYVLPAWAIYRNIDQPTVTAIRYCSTYAVQTRQRTRRRVVRLLLRLASTTCYLHTVLQA
jgi:hypothetical protein